MNEYKEAFETLTDWFHSYTDDNGIRVHERHITKSYEEAKKTISELVEKATPKKPIGKHTQYKCPVCGRRVRSGKGSSSHIRDNVCQRCYQVLDWGDEE